MISATKIMRGDCALCVTMIVFGCGKLQAMEIGNCNTNEYQDLNCMIAV